MSEHDLSLLGAEANRVLRLLRSNVRYVNDQTAFTELLALEHFKMPRRTIKLAMRELLHTGHVTDVATVHTRRGHRYAFKLDLFAIEVAEQFNGFAWSPRGRQHRRTPRGTSKPCGRTMVTPSRDLYCVPPHWLLPACEGLKERLDLHLPSISLDHCWVAGRGLAKALSKIEPGWGYLDIVRFFPNIDQARLWKVLPHHVDRQLVTDVRKMFDRLGCDDGIPEGCPFAPALANFYLLDLDARWQRRAVRYGDNYATADVTQLTHELLDIGLRSEHRDTFVGRQTKIPIK